MGLPPCAPGSACLAHFLAELAHVMRELDRTGAVDKSVTVAHEIRRGGGEADAHLVAAGFRRRIADGTIPCIRHGRTVRVDLAALATTGEHT